MSDDVDGSVQVFGGNFVGGFQNRVDVNVQFAAAAGQVFEGDAVVETAVVKVQSAAV